MRGALCATLLVLGWAGASHAATRSYELQKQGAESTCVLLRPAAAGAEAAAKDSLTVRVRKGPDVQKAVLRPDSTPAGDLELKPDEKQEFLVQAIALEKLAGVEQLQVLIDGVSCEPFSPKALAQEGDPKPPEDKDEAPALTAEAWWQRHGLAELQALRSGLRFPRGTRFLVHFDSGARAAPFPSSLPERRPLQVLVLTRKPALDAELLVSTCEDVQTFRLREKEQPAVTPDGKAERDGEAVEAAGYRLVPVGSLIECGAGTLAYSLKLEGASVEVSTRVRIRPVSHLAFTAVYGFDFARQHSYPVVDGRIAEAEDRAGLGLRVGITWQPWGVDYEDLRWYNRVFNVVLAVDPSAPTERFMTGLALTPTGGLALVVGASFQKVTVLQPGFEVGDAFSGEGELPTRQRWRASGVAPFIGLSVDDDLFQVIGGRLSSGQ